MYFFNDLPMSGAVKDPEIVKVYDLPEAPPYFENIKNALKVYGCSVKLRDGDSTDLVLDNTLTVVRLVGCAVVLLYSCVIIQYTVVVLNSCII